MFDKLQNRIPEGEPDLEIGPLSVWVPGYTYVNQVNQGDYAYLATPTLLETENIILFSAGSETPVFTFKKFLTDITVMYDRISIKQMAEFSSHDSEFSLKLTNDLGQIAIAIEYHGWSVDGKCEFKDKIDQSYLPKIIKELKQILAKFT
jgi:hypothetical protein